MVPTMYVMTKKESRSEIKLVSLIAEALSGVTVTPLYNACDKFFTPLYNLWSVC